MRSLPQALIRSLHVVSLICLLTIAGLSAAAVAQEAPAPQPNSSALIGQMSRAFSGGQAIHQMTLSGNATWHAGSEEDSGPVTLTASADGQFQMTLQLGSGQKLETRTGTGASAACNWTGSDGVAHEIDLGNCWKPAVWFLPAISLQPSMLSGSLVAGDLGQGTIGSDSTLYRHLQAGLQLTGPPVRTIANIQKQSTTDIGLDPNTMLPAVLAFNVHPDNGAQFFIPIEVHYSNYQNVSGAMIPFLIQRYVNNSLQLEITVESAQVN